MYLYKPLFPIDGNNIKLYFIRTLTVSYFVEQ